MVTTIHFGEHLTIDGYGGSETQLNDKELIFSILQHLPKILGMKIIYGPRVLSISNNSVKDPGGWSGFVIIAESHISIHTFPKRKFLSADVYTCKNEMDQVTILNFFAKKFKLQEVETNFIKRGKKYPVNNVI